MCMKRFIALSLILSITLSSASFALPKIGKEKKSKEVFPEMSDSKGYVGTLPNLEEHFKQFQEEEAKPLFEYQDGFNSPDDIKPTPRDNPSFVNIIKKKDKS